MDGIEGHIGASGLENAQHTHDHVEAALHAHADHDVRSDAATDELPGEPLGALVQFTEVHPVRAVYDGDRVRRPGRLPLEHLVHAQRLRTRRHGPSAPSAAVRPNDRTPNGESMMVRGDIDRLSPRYPVRRRVRCERLLPALREREKPPSHNRENGLRPASKLVGTTGFEPATP
jgi:hypothetical protein